MSWLPDCWSLRILKQALDGATHFAAFQQALGITSTTLTRRLNGLVEEGLMERRLYLERPRREEYVLTESGQAFRAVIEALRTWNESYARQPRRNSSAQAQARAAISALEGSGC